MKWAATPERENPRGEIILSCRFRSRDTTSDGALDELIGFTFVGGGEGAMTRGEMVQHVLNHTTYRRGFVADHF